MECWLSELAVLDVSREYRFATSLTAMTVAWEAIAMRSQDVTERGRKCLRRQGKPGRVRPQGMEGGRPRSPNPMGATSGAATPRCQPQNDSCRKCVLLRAGNAATTGAKSVKGLTPPCAAPED